MAAHIVKSGAIPHRCIINANCVGIQCAITDGRVIVAGGVSQKRIGPNSRVDATSVVL